ncbi:MAG: SDR family oxidoreductase [Myxococcota bacterium]|nr:SDR family oxidoreductase [Myxococcota bacterium]
MELGLTNKLALVCAGSRGLGKSVAVELAREGAHIALCGRDRDAIGRATEAVTAVNGDGALGMVADVSSPTDLDAFVAEAESGFQRGVDIVVWNGGGPPPGSLLSLPPEAVRAGIAQHMEGALHIFRRTIPGMQTRGFGRIIAITSIAAKQPVLNIGVSTAVRAGLHGILKTLSREVAGDGVTVNAVMPSNILTDRLRSLARHHATEHLTEDETLAAISKSSPVGRLGRPEELSAAVAFLASTRASFINGVSLSVDGGECSGLF